MAGTQIYGLVDPESGLIRYVGKTIRTLKERLKQHKCDSLRRASNHKDRWLNKLYRDGTPPLMILIEADSSWERECFWIAHYRAAGIDLLNGNDGGEGQKRSPSAETRAKMSATMTGRVRTPEHQAKLAAAMRGQKRTPEQRERMRQAHLGKQPTNLDQLIAYAKARKQCSLEQRQKISQALKGHPVPIGTRAAVSAAHKGVKHIGGTKHQAVEKKTDAEQ